MSIRFLIAAALAALVIIVAIVVGVGDVALIALFSDKEMLRTKIEQLGPWGPLALIALEALAIVVSPIPSGPIAIAAGAAFGPFLGTIYIVIGATAGGMAAFWIARTLGHDFVRRWEAARKALAYLEQGRSQFWLMVIVFASRLVPFLSFDVISYAAGLTPLAFWRFAIATILGVIPVAFLFAYAGENLIEANSTSIMIALGIVSGVTLVPILARFLWLRISRAR